MMVQTDNAPLRQIFALGDAAPLDETINAYIVNLAPKPRPTVCFIGTASGDDPGYFQKFTDGFSRLPCTTKSLSLFRLPSSDLRGYVFDSDVVYVGGGNTRSMLAVWREWGLDAILREAWEAGIVLCGPSAGSLCWFEQGTTDSVPGQITSLTCLGFLPGSNCPHYDSEPLRRPAYLEMVKTGVLKNGYACDDLAGLVFHGTELAEVVSARENARAYRVERNGNGVRETLLPATTILGPHP